MQIIKKYQNEVYTMALSLTCNAQKSKIAAVKAFEKILKSYHSDSPETKIKLYKELLKNIGIFTINKNDLDRKGIINSVKHRLGLFDKKVFVLKYEFNCGLKDIVYILDSSCEKVKKSLVKSTERLAKILEDMKNEVQ
ncbi:MAG: hypothetical protein FWH43_02725 [Endomicrobia bacterium]|nr:hypothetical protein [Endomicrobiia bacterium]